jgi:hypothetical protein
MTAAQAGLVRFNAAGRILVSDISDFQTALLMQRPSESQKYLRLPNPTKPASVANSQYRSANMEDLIKTRLIKELIDKSMWEENPLEANEDEVIQTVLKVFPEAESSSIREYVKMEKERLSKKITQKENEQF